MKKLVIFDLDGTLLDTVADLAGATNHALKSCGFPGHDPQLYKTFVGNGIDKLFERALPESERTRENIARVRAEFLPYYNSHNTELTRPYPGITAMLEKLQHAGVRIAVASNKYEEATCKLIGHYFPSISFSMVLGQGEGRPAKPDPAIVMCILAKVGVERSETLFVGDSGVDMQTAWNAGVASSGVSWGFRPVSELRSFRPDHIVGDPARIVEIALE